jgi:hypothetical protein
VKCIKVHEQSHADDANADNACKGAPDGYQVIADSPAQRRESEIKAYQKELECLQKALKTATAAGASNDPELNCVCRPGNVQNVINEVNERLSDWQKSDPNGPFPE